MCYLTVKKSMWVKRYRNVNTYNNNNFIIISIINFILFFNGDNYNKVWITLWIFEFCDHIIILWYTLVRLLYENRNYSDYIIMLLWICCIVSVRRNIEIIFLLTSIIYCYGIIHVVIHYTLYQYTHHNEFCAYRVNKKRCYDKDDVYVISTHRHNNI